MNPPNIEISYAFFWYHRCYYIVLYTWPKLYKVLLVRVTELYIIWNEWYALQTVHIKILWYALPFGFSAYWHIYYHDGDFSIGFRLWIHPYFFLSAGLMITPASDMNRNLPLFFSWRSWHRNWDPSTSDRSQEDIL